MSDIRFSLQDIPFVIVDGVATRLYMPERVTLDLDILIFGWDRANLFENLSRSGARYLQDLSIPGSSWILANSQPLDILESCYPWQEEAIRDPNYSVDHYPVIKLPYLVLMKLDSSRSQDIADISRMMGAADDQDLDQVRSVCQRHMSSALDDLESLIELGKLEYEDAPKADPEIELELD